MSMKKIVILDLIGEGYEPYDRKFMLQMTYEFCVRNSSIIRNVSAIALKRKTEVDRAKVLATFICFEIDELSEEKWKFLHNSIGSWAVKLKVLPDDCETTILIPSNFS
jgi:hypothetical protein